MGRRPSGHSVPSDLWTGREPGGHVGLSVMAVRAVSLKTCREAEQYFRLRVDQPLIAPHIVHVGLMKTGSTWLQRQVFPKVERAVPTSDNKVMTDLLMNLTDDDRFMADTFRAALDEIGGRVLMSWECLSGRPWGHWDIGRNVDRLVSVAPEAMIVLVRRDQGEWLRSLYGQYVNRGGIFGQERFEREILDSRYLNVDATVAKFEERFPKVLVVDYADLRSGVGIGKVEQFADVRFRGPLDGGAVNPTLTGWRLVTLRAVNRLFRESEHNPSPRWPIEGAAGMRNVLQRRESSRW